MTDQLFDCRYKMQSELDYQQKERERLKQLQKDYKNNEEKNMKQMKMWSDLKALLEIKRRSLKQQMERNAINEYKISSKPDHLVL